MAKSDYFRDRHLMAVQGAALGIGASAVALATLTVLCWYSEFKSPITKPGREVIAERIGCSVPTVARALAELRALGLIEPIAYKNGGRHMATVYKLTTKTKNRITDDTESGDGRENPETVSNPSGNRIKSSGKPYHPRYTTHNHTQNLSQKEEKGRGLVAPDAPPHGGLSRGGDRSKQLVPVRPEQVRGMLIDWGFGASDIETFQEREVVALLRAEGFRLAV